MRLVCVALSLSVSISASIWPTFTGELKSTKTLRIVPDNSLETSIWFVGCTEPVAVIMIVRSTRVAGCQSKGVFSASSRCTKWQRCRATGGVLARPPHISLRSRSRGTRRLPRPSKARISECSSCVGCLFIAVAAVRWKQAASYATAPARRLMWLKPPKSNSCVRYNPYTPHPMEHQMRRAGGGQVGVNSTRTKRNRRAPTWLDAQGFAVAP